jgi:hypothetical protein
MSMMRVTFALLVAAVLSPRAHRWRCYTSMMLATVGVVSAQAPPTKVAVRDEYQLLPLNIRPAGEDECRPAPGGAPSRRVVLVIAGALDCVPHSPFLNLIELVSELELRSVKVHIHLMVDMDRERLGYDHTKTGTGGYLNQGGMRTVSSQWFRTRRLSTAADVRPGRRLGTADGSGHHAADGSGHHKAHSSTDSPEKQHGFGHHNDHNSSKGDHVKEQPVPAPIPEVFKRPLAQLEQLRVAWGSRVRSWVVSTTPLLDQQKQDRDFPNVSSYKTCSWPSAVNGLASHYKLQSVAQRAVYCPSDIVIRMRPNMAVDLMPFWPHIVRDLGRAWDMFVPGDTANGAGVNDNFGVMTVQAWRRYASLYLNFDRLLGTKTCYHSEVFVKLLVGSHMRTQVQKSLPLSIKVCYSFGDYAAKAFRAQIAQDQEAAARMRPGIPIPRPVRPG